ncbi:MAG: hypothetical protein M1833_004113 [Piccolia ochrophora]|nr:MAG: hypothetical protein M1833_004113 [Piccolia ochrophora]
MGNVTGIDPANYGYSVDVEPIVEFLQVQNCFWELFHELDEKGIDYQEYIRQQFPEPPLCVDTAAIRQAETQAGIFATVKTLELAYAPYKVAAYTINTSAAHVQALPPKGPACHHQCSSPASHSETIGVILEDHSASTQEDTINSVPFGSTILCTHIVGTDVYIDQLVAVTVGDISSVDVGVGHTAAVLGSPSSLEPVPALSDTFGDRNLAEVIAAAEALSLVQFRHLAEAIALRDRLHAEELDLTERFNLIELDQAYVDDFIRRELEALTAGDLDYANFIYDVERLEIIAGDKALAEALAATGPSPNTDKDREPAPVVTTIDSSESRDDSIPDDSLTDASAELPGSTSIEDCHSEMSSSTNNQAGNSSLTSLQKQRQARHKELGAPQPPGTSSKRVLTDEELFEDREKKYTIDMTLNDWELVAMRAVANDTSAPSESRDLEREMCGYDQDSSDDDNLGQAEESDSEQEVMDDATSREDDPMQDDEDANVDEDEQQREAS